MLSKHERYYIKLNEKMKSGLPLAEKLEIIEKAFLENRITNAEWNGLQARAFYEEKKKNDIHN